MRMDVKIPHRATIHTFLNKFKQFLIRTKEMNRNLRDLTEKKRIFFIKSLRNFAWEYGVVK
jgi:hypothetical protein